jgi:hypothetical protein
LGFLGSGRFGFKHPAFEAWISLDFLGFSRPNRDFSMGYADFSLNDFSQASLASRGGTEACGRGHAEGRIVHDASLT